MKHETPAYDELKALLRSKQHKYERIAVIPDELWSRLRLETYDVFGEGGDTRGVLWYRGRTMLMPQSNVLNLCNSEVEPDG